MEQTGKDSLLIIDDMPHHLKLLQHYLQQYDFKVYLADSGQMALEMLDNDTFNPDLILLDAIMPEMDGYEVCRRLKVHDKTRDIPVIFMTSLWEIQDKMSAFSVGASDFLPKPFPPEELIARMTVHLELNKTKRRLNQEITTRNLNYQRLISLGQELEITAQWVGQRLQQQFQQLQPTLANLLASKKPQYNEIKQLFKSAESKIDDILFIANSNTSALEKQRLNTQEIVQSILTPLKTKYPQLKVNFPDTWIDAEGAFIWVKKIWEILIDFSLRQAGKNVQLTINNELFDSTVRFSLKNNGTALNKSQIAALLNYREKTKETEMDNELFLIRYLVEKCGGEFSIENRGLIGNTFYFTLPAALDFGNTYNRYLSLSV
ncbi:MAG: hypothetical protein RIT27_1629 [Pseudomonadota bacterium]|jgi:DNA-binding response OmpR family regulator